jgi:antitoxin component YwqK of YwqJK toxin-antitoxin module
MIGYTLGELSGYTKVLITLEIPDDANTDMNRSNIINEEYAKYKSSKAIVTSITDRKQKSHNRFKLFYGNCNDLNFYKVNDIITGNIIFYKKIEPVIQDSDLFDLINLEDGAGIGVHKKWFDNGSIQLEHNYKYKKLDGVYKEWNSFGVLIEESIYSNNKIESTKRFNSNGKICLIENYKDGLLHGENKTLDPDTNIVKVEIYKNGKLINQFEE